MTKCARCNSSSFTNEGVWEKCNKCGLSRVRPENNPFGDAEKSTKLVPSPTKKGHKKHSPKAKTESTS